MQHWDIAMIGRARSGKDTAASRLVHRHNYFRVAFADPVRDAALRLNPLVEAGTTLAEVVRSVGWEVAKDRYPEVRATLQRVGELMRHYDPDWWLNIAARKLDAAKSWNAPVVVTDCRYPNEFEMLSERGFIMVEVLRAESAPRPDEHYSESALDDYLCDTTIFNSEGIEYLHEQIERIALS